ncbi:uncharacterized protein LOC126457178 isoform X1 [Schistocerca serialis cubense]|uniref:uncharacterized protein LOC126457178 isoform X1 n=2 Tax=Schistocerca serialis cubense TaxID=2023355 RepID=UPI00214E463D|nr:uncharacterized protein LOC126457178 isoform X1 [Schistocerca serialis cubense]
MGITTCAVFLFTCLLGTSLQAENFERLSGPLCSGGPGLWPVPADCRGFVLCVADAAPSNATAGRLLRCPPGTAFSAQLRTCVPASEVAGCAEQADENNTDPVHIHVPSRQRRAEGVDLAGAEEDCDAGIVGPTCADCSRLVICAQLNGRIIPVGSVSCPSLGGGNTCSTQQNSCVPDGPACEVAPAPLPFRCLEPGIFPDPEDCIHYHLCGTDLGHISDKCDERYDPESKSCMDSPATKEPTTPTSCGAAVDCSSKLGAVHALAHAPAYYAVCLPSLAPAKDGTKPEITNHISVLSCPEGQLFDDKLKKCRPSCGSRRGRMPVEGDCRAYIECTGDRAQPRRLMCGPGLAFHAVRRMCLPESQVPGCSQQESVTSPPHVNPPATTATSQTKQVASSPVQATSVTPAVTNTHAPQHPFCITEGRFIDHSNCRRYVHCWRAWGGALTMALRWCPLFTYFDPTTSACRIGFC